MLPLFRSSTKKMAISPSTDHRNGFAVRRGRKNQSSRSFCSDEIGNRVQRESALHQEGGATRTINMAVVIAKLGKPSFTVFLHSFIYSQNSIFHLLIYFSSCCKSAVSVGTAKEVGTPVLLQSQAEWYSTAGRDRQLYTGGNLFASPVYSDGEYIRT